MPDLTYTTIEFRGMSFGRGTVRRLLRGQGLVGWEELPPFTRARVPRFGLHGNAPAAVHFEGRTVIMTGFIEAATDRDALVQEFRRLMIPNIDPVGTEPLTVTMAGETLTADAQLVAAGIEMTELWGAGWFRFKAQWECPDPRRFGARERQVSAITTPTGGLTWPVTFPITFPAAPISGSVTLHNAGSAPAPAVFELTGPLVTPGVILSTGRRFAYAGTVNAGQVLTIDTATSGGWIDGANVSADQTSDLTCELELPPGTTTAQYLGSPLAGSPSLAASFRHANW